MAVVPPGGASTRISFALIGEVLVEEGGYLRIGVEAVRELGEAVPLVLVEEVFHCAAVLPYPLDDLLGLPYGNAGVVLAVDHHERRPYVPGLVKGAYGLEELTIRLERPVLGLAQPATVAAGVLEEGDEVGNAYDVHPGAPELGVLGEGGEHHEPAVGATHDRDALVSPPAQPVGCVRQVSYGVHPELDVVEVGVGLAVAGGAAHVGEEDGVAAMQEVLRHGGEGRPRLALRPAVHVHYYGGVLSLGLVEEGRDLTPVEAGVA